MKAENINIAEYLDAAEQSGVVKLPMQDGEFYLVSPRVRTTGEDSIFSKSTPLLQPPLSRLAYSDRTAWLMAALSELAYIPFEKDQESRAKLIFALTEADMVLEAIFNNDVKGTQAFLARREQQFRVLVFRGTEAELDDIKTDLDARFFRTPHGMAHEGFITAYQCVADEIVAALNQHPDQGTLPFLITGHSLGGALATVASMDLEDKILVSACYTYGSPRVGTAEWSDALKTPVYRVVNGADAVPMLPGSALLRFILVTICKIPVLSLLKGLINTFLQAGFVGYQHVGDMRFLDGHGTDAALKSGSAGTMSRIKCVVIDTLLKCLLVFNPKPFAQDHRIAHYRTKLQVIAEKRNQG